MTGTSENDPSIPPPPDKGGVPSWLIFIAVVLAVSFSAKLVLDSVSRAPGRIIESSAEVARNAVQQVSGAIKDIFQVEPEVKLQSKVIQLQSSPILELAFIEKEFHLTNTWKGKWLRSEKELTVSGTYRAKAGFDLEKQFVVEVNQTEQLVYVSLPSPELLSVDLQDDLELEGKSGLWNRITDEDRTMVMNDFRRDAEAHVLESGLLEEVRQEAEKRLREALPNSEWEIIILFPEDKELREE
ncbi:MAG: DUF4230 domain-containing protein [Verrucomicrobiota bacterium]